MPPDLGTAFAPGWAGWPPHMSEEDKEIFERGRDIIFKDAVNVFYDVGLGGQQLMLPETESQYREMWRRVTQKRIDVLVETPTEWKIIEIRPHATSTAAGRLLQYKEMWSSDPPDKKPYRLILMTDKADPDLIPVLKSLTIELIEI